MVLTTAIYQQLKFELILSEYIPALRKNKQNFLLLVTVVIFNGGGGSQKQHEDQTTHGPSRLNFD